MFALVAMLAPPEAVGSVTGVVGAVGGLGGFIPPLVMGLVYGQFHSYAVGLAALAVVAALALTLAATAVRGAAGASCVDATRGVARGPGTGPTYWDAYR